MYKLLTEEQKKKVAREYALRRIAIILWAAIAIIIVSLAGFFPSFVLSKVRHKEISDRLKVVGEVTLEDGDKELKEWLSGFNTKLKTLAPKRDTDRPSLLIEEVIGEKTAGIKLTSLEWKKKDGQQTLSISGVARDRQALVSFENSLRMSGRFGEVSLPISALSKDRDIGFQVTLTYAPNP